MICLKRNLIKKKSRRKKW